jgi:hypothetical protein
VKRGDSTLPRRSSLNALLVFAQNLTKNAKEKVEQDGRDPELNAFNV